MKTTKPNIKKKNEYALSKLSDRERLDMAIAAKVFRERERETELLGRHSQDFKERRERESQPHLPTKGDFTN